MQWFLNFNMHQNHLGDILIQITVSHPTVSISVDLRWWVDIFNEFPGDANAVPSPGLHSENQSSALP